MKEALAIIFSAQARKAWGSGLVALLIGVQAAMGEGGTFADITSFEWITIAVGVLGAFGITYSVPNAPAPFVPAEQPYSVDPASYSATLDTTGTSGYDPA